MIIFLKFFLITSLLHIPLFSHCQIPCGIYSDALQIVQIKEDLQTIDKSITMIKKLSGNSDPQALNQASRWINTKDQHAQKIQDAISQYFLTQRIKQNSKNYENKLITLHQLLVSVMKCKQSVNKENVKNSIKLIENFSELYFDKHGLDHLNKLQTKS